MSGHQDLATLLAFRLPNRDTSWMEEGLCAYYFDPDLWFPVGHGDSTSPRSQYRRTADKAMEICAECPVRDRCYKDAKDREEINGIWGGVDFYVPWRKRKQQEKEVA